VERGAAQYVFIRRAECGGPRSFRYCPYQGDAGRKLPKQIPRGSVSRIAVHDQQESGMARDGGRDRREKHLYLCGLDDRGTRRSADCEIQRASEQKSFQRVHAELRDLYPASNRHVFSPLGASGLYQRLRDDESEGHCAVVCALRETPPAEQLQSSAARWRGMERSSYTGQRSFWFR